MNTFRWRTRSILVVVAFVALLLVVVIQQIRIDRQEFRIKQLNSALEMEVRMRELNGITARPIKESDGPPRWSRVRPIMEQQ